MWIFLPFFTQHNVFKDHPYLQHMSVLHFFSLPSQIFIVWMYHILINCSPIYGHLVCFHLFAVVNNVVINNYIQVFFFPEDVYFHFSCIYTWMALLNHMKFYVYLFKEQPNSLSKQLDYFILLTKIYECPNRSHPCQHLGGSLS